MQTGAIWVIDDDTDDHEMVSQIFSELQLPNELVFLPGAKAALDKLKAIPHAPFIILCDVNLPGMNGFELRAQMLQDPSNKMHSVPFIYWSSTASEKQIRQAYDLSAHGFFIKESSFQKLKDLFIQIIRYWQKSKMPAKGNQLNGMISQV
jgi:CheY-like chemotaxis protein